MELDFQLELELELGLGLNKLLFQGKFHNNIHNLLFHNLKNYLLQVPQ